jgi:hypothetical protein
VEIDASVVTVGGTTPRAGNVISGNSRNGVLIAAFFLNGFNFVPANGNLVAGNFIGTDPTGTMPLGNGVDGVTIFGNFTGAGGNTVGGTTAAAANVIAFNSHNGVTVGQSPIDSTAVQNPVLSNSIDDIGGLGIDLGDDGVTPNHSGPPAFAPNNDQNFPVLAAAADFGSLFVVRASLSASPNTTYTIQFFGDTVPDPSGMGQGQFLVGTTSRTTDSSGNVTFNFFTSAPPAATQFITATATDPQGNTSEFAQDVPLGSFTTPIGARDDSYHTDINTTLTVPAPGVRANDIAENGGTFTSVLVAAPAHGSVKFNADGSFTYTPATNFVGPDTFRYMDVAKNQQSNVATVTITVSPKTFIVTNTNNSGPGSLRQALLDANLSDSAPPDTIEFDIPAADVSASGTFTISPLSALPVITHPTIIDGYTQPGSSSNTLALGDDAKILIQLDGLSSFFSDGLVIAAGGSTVQGLAITDFNNGIHLTGGGDDLITGNFIGTDPSGTAAFEGNNNGVEIDNSANNTVGGTSPAARNVISGNIFGFGIQIFNGSTGNLVQGNYIGTDATGLHALGNFFGIFLEDAPFTTIGGTAAGAGNVISASSLFGINSQGGFTGGPDNSVIQGNFIGTDATGEAALGNAADGLSLGAGNNLVIGGDTPGAGNVISGNGASGFGSGITLFTSGALVQGNKIGTDAAGTSILPNSTNGIQLFTGGNTVGGTSAGAGNVIAGNGQVGIEIDSASNNLLENNFIGTDRTGTINLGNGGDGVVVTGGGAANNTVGGTSAGVGNVIAFNGATGVAVLDPFALNTNLGNAILSNLIYGNAALGIDLGGDGVTPNHSGGLIAGPNGFENFPVLTSAVSSATQTTIDGTLNAADNSAFTIQFYVNTTADPSGFGQGQILVGSTSVNTDASGNATFSAVFDVAFAAGLAVSATATDPNGNTSEFAKDIAITASAALPRALLTSVGAASVDAALQSLSIGALDETILNAVAGAVSSSRPKRALPPS